MSDENGFSIVDLQDSPESGESFIPDEPVENLREVPAPAFETIRTGDSILIRTDVATFREHSIVPAEVWEPLLGGEKFRQELWDQVLVNEGDEVIVKGSTVTRMLFGGYGYNPNTGLAEKGTRSDIDIDVYTPEIWSRVGDICATDKYVARSALVDEIKVDFANQKRLGAILDEGLFTIQKQIVDNQLPDELNILTVAAQQREWATSNHPESLVLVNGFSCQECICVKMKRVGGELEAEVVDPMLYLRKFSLVVGNTHTQSSIQEQLHEYAGYMFPGPNSASAYKTFIEAAISLPHVEIRDKAIPIYTAGAIARNIRAHCELDVGIYGAPYNGIMQNHSYMHYLDMFAFSARLIAQEEHVFKAAPGYEDKINENEMYERIEEIFQENFARAAFASPARAISYMFADLPLGNTISKEVADKFRIYHSTYQPNNLMLGDIVAMHVTEADLPTDPEQPDNNEGMHFLTRLYQLASKHYTSKAIPMHPLNAQGAAEEIKVNFFEMDNPPKNMSEVLALVFVSANMDMQRNGDEIRKAIEKWKPEGQLGLCWKRSKDVEFDMGVNEKELEEQIRYFSGLLD